jgi:choline transporter-like protein 2/4/5
VAIWYFSCGTDSGPERPISRSLWRAFRYHFGSLAFGSFLLAVIWSIKFCLYYLKAKANLEGGKNCCMNCILSCAICLVNCFERFIKFLTKNAYIQIALLSSNFCKAAKDAFFLVLRNCLRFLTLGSIGDVFMFFGKFIITLISTFAGYIIITRADRWADKLNSPFLPTVVFMFISYLIAALFMVVYGMACDSILHCFLADEELMEGGVSMHAPEPLNEFMNKEREAEPGRKCCK